VNLRFQPLANTGWIPEWDYKHIKQPDGL
jgi:hypothetical protein